MVTISATQLARRQDKRREATEATPETLIRDTHKLLQRVGIVRSHSWVTRTVRDYCSSVAANGYPFGRFLLARVELNAQARQAIRHDPELRCLLDYADPTGETAVNGGDPLGQRSLRRPVLRGGGVNG